jgi:hypothetical protein
VPYLAFATRPPLLPATAIVAFASLGYGGTLSLQQLFADALAPAQRGRAFSLAVAGQLSAQGVAAWAAGALALALPVGGAMAVTAALSIFASVALTHPRRLAAGTGPDSPAAPRFVTEGEAAR